MTNLSNVLSTAKKETEKNRKNKEKRQKREKDRKERQILSRGEAILTFDLERIFSIVTDKMLLDLAKEGQSRISKSLHYYPDDSSIWKVSIHDFIIDHKGMIGDRIKELEEMGVYVSMYTGSYQNVSGYSRDFYDGYDHRPIEWVNAKPMNLMFTIKESKNN